MSFYCLKIPNFIAKGIPKIFSGTAVESASFTARSVELITEKVGLTSTLDGLASANSYLIKKTPDCKKLPLIFSDCPPATDIKALDKFYEKQDGILARLTNEQSMQMERGGIQEPINLLAYKISGAYHVDRFVHSSKGYTSGLDDCIGVLLYNGNDAYLYHLSPNMHKCDSAIKYMQETLASRIAELTGQTKCRACLVGGKKEYSKELYGNIRSVLNKYNIKTQEVLFNKSGHTDIYYDLDKGIFPQFSNGCSEKRIMQKYENVVT